MITFTGGIVGQGIMRICFGNVKKIGLELGGKSPIVFADTDIDKTVEWVMMGIFLNQGKSAVRDQADNRKSIKINF
ncbi:MAG: aldehyde dehydrogenase family protein [Ruminococcus bicirculans (ex Wegman et al. 2014)]